MAPPPQGMASVLSTHAPRHRPPMSSPRYFATAARHLETLLAEELRALGVPEVTETRAGVRFGASLADAYRVCLWSRVANRVLMPLAEFPAESPEALYVGVQAIAWEDHLDPGATFAVHLDTARSAINHSHFGALKVKDAIVDRLRCLLYTSPSPRDGLLSRMPSSA